MVESIVALGALLAALSVEDPATGRRVRVYRGTQRGDSSTVRGAPSFTSSREVALVWSAVPGGWSRDPHFLPTSTVEFVEIRTSRVLRIGVDRTWSSIGEVVKALKMPDEEVRKVFSYLHNRIFGKARGGEFRYLVRDEEGEERGEDEVPFSLLRPESLLSEAREDFRYDPGVVDRVFVDSFALADAPAVQRAALAAGYDAIVYRDVFEGGRGAAEVLLGKDVLDLDGVEEDEDLSGEMVPTHLTIRPLDSSRVFIIEKELSQDVLGLSDSSGN